MESLPALPPDLAAVVGSSVRGAAPLLAPADLDEAAALGETSFDMCLALLTPPLPSGEGLPAAGNGLPSAPAVSSADGAPDDALPTELMLALAPAAAAVQAQLRPAEPLPAAGLAAEVSLVSALPVGDAVDVSTFTLPPSAPPPLSSAEQLAVVAQTQTPAEPSAAAPLDSAAVAADSALVPDPVEPPAPERAAPRAMERAALDGLWQADQGFEPPAAQRPEARASVVPAVPQPAALPQYQTIAVAATSTAEAGAVVQSATRRGEPLLGVQAASASADGVNVPFTDWLPSSGAVGNSSHASAPAQTAPGTPVDTRSPTWQEAFASRVQWLVDHDVGEAHIKLNPPELGAVDVKISLVDDKTFVQLTTATVGARDELQHSLPRLRELFAGSGLELGGASVQNGRDGQQSAHGHSQGGGRGAADPREFASFSSVSQEPRVAAQRPSLGRIDTFA